MQLGAIIMFKATRIQLSTHVSVDMEEKWKKMYVILEKGAHGTKRRKHGYDLFAQQRNKFKTGQSLTENAI